MSPLTLTPNVPGGLSLSPIIASRPVVYVVTDAEFAGGADVEGVGDSYGPLQAAITASVVAKASGASHFFPAGTFRYTNTLTFPAGTGGGWVLGSGSYIGDAQAGTVKGPQSLLVWDGTVGGTMVKQIGSLGWGFEHLAFVGRRTSGATNRAGIGYLCAYQVGYGSGVGSFRHVSFYDIATAVQMGELTADGNCADIAFENCQWENCGVGLLVNNTQGLNYRFESPSVVNCPQFVDCEAGGSVLVNMLNTATCGGTGADDWIFTFDNINDNTGACIINGWRAEQNTKQLVKSGVLGHVVINGFEEAQSDQNVTMVQLTGTTMTMRDSRLVTNDPTNPFFSLAWGGGGQKGGLFLENVHFDVSTWLFNNWFKFNVNQDVVLQTKNCTYGDTAERLADINSHLVHGPVTHFTQTTDGSAKFAYLDGAASGNIYNVCRIPTDTAWLVDAYIVGQKSDGSVIGSFHRRITVKNVGGTTALVGAIQTVGTDQNAGAWAVDVVASDALDGIRAQVTGLAATTINWKIRFVGNRADAIS